MPDGRNHAATRGEDRVYKARRGGQTRQQVLQAAGLNIGIDQLPGQHCHADARECRNPKAGEVVGCEARLMRPSGHASLSVDQIPGESLAVAGHGEGRPFLHGLDRIGHRMSRRQFRTDNQDVDRQAQLADGEIGIFQGRQA